MLDWQLTAAVLAVVLLLIAAVGVWRYTRPVMFVWIGLLIAVPAAGFAWYAISPGPAPDLSRPLWLLAYIPVAVALVAAVWVAVWIFAQRRALEMRRLALVSIGMLVTFEGIVLAISDVLALWEPGFAVANLVLNGAWAVLWLPRRLRTSEATASVEIAAPRPKVFAFVATPANWPRFHEGTVEAVTRPDGPIAPRTEIDVRARYHSAVRGPRLLPDILETLWVVQAVTPDESFTMTRPNQPPNSTTYRFTDSPVGTRIDLSSTGVAPIRAAILGIVVEMWWSWSTRLEIVGRGFARLKALLEKEGEAG